MLGCTSCSGIRHTLIKILAFALNEVLQPAQRHNFDLVGTCKVVLVARRRLQHSIYTVNGNGTMPQHEAHALIQGNSMMQGMQQPGSTHLGNQMRTVFVKMRCVHASKRCHSVLDFFTLSCNKPQTMSLLHLKVAWHTMQCFGSLRFHAYA